MTRSRRAALAAFLLSGCCLFGCSDPGSGGTGVPDASSGIGGEVSAPAPIAPLPGSGPPQALDACAAPPNTVAQVFAGTIEARLGACLLVGGRRVDISTARIERSSGEEAGADALQVGLRVVVTPQAGDPSSAALVRLEDA